MTRPLSTYRSTRDFSRTAEPQGAPEPDADDEGVVDQLARLERDAGQGTVTFDDATSLEVSHLDRVVFPAVGVTKGALMRYYARAASALLPLLVDRPLALRRFPRGVDGPSFFQQEPHDWPDAVRTAKVRLEDGTTRPRLVGGTLATLLYTVQMGAISAHHWLSRVGSIATPDHVVIDLDPAEGLPFDRVVAVAQGVREALAARGLTGSPKTSGASGLHVMIAPPRRLTWKAAAALAEGIAKDVAAALPRLTTLARSPAKRPAGTVYLDHLQNARGKTVASAWSVRATPGATVSTPLDWDEVTAGLDPRAFTMETALARLGGGVEMP